MSEEGRVRDKARALGFDVVGFARADVPLGEDHARYQAFLDGGLHGTMQYLAENAEVRRRVDTNDILPGAKTIVCLARRYRRDAASEAADPALAKRVARYARGHDYHNVVRRKLRRLAAFLRTLGTDDQPVRARPMCDDVPVLERAWAARAGLGFIGKNGLLIVPGEGSFVLLGEIVTTLELPPGTPMTERCGTCTRCLDACPTRAFAAPGVVDARRCISYQTIENRGVIPRELRAGIGDHIYGCDVCLEVCPWNRFAQAGRRVLLQVRGGIAALTLREILELTPGRFAEVFRGTAVKRLKLAGLLRNACVVAGNQEPGRGGQESGARSQEPGAGGRSTEELLGPLLRLALHPLPVVRAHAVWAVFRLGGGDRLAAARAAETDPAVLAEYAAGND